MRVAGGCLHACSCFSVPARCSAGTSGSPRLSAAASVSSLRLQFELHALEVSICASARKGNSDYLVLGATQGPTRCKK